MDLETGLCNEGILNNNTLYSEIEGFFLKKKTCENEKHSVNLIIPFILGIRSYYMSESMILGIT